MMNQVSLSASKGGGESLIIKGWKSVRITSGIERLPCDFELGMAGPVPGLENSMLVPGMKCVVSIDDDVVVTGYVDRVSNHITGGQHQIRVSGRGLCQDLVDCSAIYTGSQFLQETAYSIAQKLAKPYGVDVVKDDSDMRTIQAYNLTLGESPFTVIHKLCQYSQLLCYENENGQLVLSQAGTQGMNGSLVQGKNIEQATYTTSMDQRYKQYIVVFSGATLNGDATRGASIQDLTVTDENTPRNRVKYIIPEAGDAGFVVAKQMGTWEKNRRIARSYLLNITTPVWRDLDGNLWRPNKLVSIELPNLNFDTKDQWLIGEVTYRLDESGSHCDLTIMAQQAFTPQPNLLLPANIMDGINALGQSNGQGGGNAPATP